MKEQIGPTKLQKDIQKAQDGIKKVLIQFEKLHPDVVIERIYVDNETYPDDRAQLVLNISDIRD